MVCTQLRVAWPPEYARPVLVHRTYRRRQEDSLLGAVESGQLFKPLDSLTGGSRGFRVFVEAFRRSKKRHVSASYRRCRERDRRWRGEARHPLAV